MKKYLQGASLPKEKLKGKANWFLIKIDVKEKELFFDLIIITPQFVKILERAFASISTKAINVVRHTL